MALLHGPCGLVDVFGEVLGVLLSPLLVLWVVPLLEGEVVPIPCGHAPSDQ